MTAELYVLIGMLIAFTSTALSISALYVMQKYVAPRPQYDVPDEREESEMSQADLYMLIHEIHERLKVLENAKKPARKTARKTNGQFAENLQ